MADSTLLSLASILKASALSPFGPIRALLTLLPTTMQTHEFEQDGLRIVELEGEIDLARSPELRRTLDVHAKAHTPALALDFRGVDFIDSSGLATIIEYCRKAHEFGGKFAIYGLRERVRTVFEIVRLNEILALFDTFEQAREALLPASPSAA